MRKNDQMVHFLTTWLEMMRCESYRLLDDSPSTAPNYPEFIENRHDQSIFSILYHKSLLEALPPETYFGESTSDWRKEGRDYPIWASRNASRWPLYQKWPLDLPAQCARGIRKSTLRLGRKFWTELKNAKVGT